MIKLLAAAAVLPALIMTAAPAHADTNTYLNDTSNAGLGSEDGDTGLLGAGWQICRALTAGESQQQVAATLIYASDKSQGTTRGLTPKEADQMVIYANDDLCPGA